MKTVLKIITTVCIPVVLAGCAAPGYYTESGWSSSDTTYYVPVNQSPPSYTTVYHYNVRPHRHHYRFPVNPGPSYHPVYHYPVRPHRHHYRFPVNPGPSYHPVYHVPVRPHRPGKRSHWHVKNRKHQSTFHVQVPRHKGNGGGFIVNH